MNKDFILVAEALDQRGLFKESDCVMNVMRKLAQSTNYFKLSGVNSSTYSGTASENEALRKAINPSAPDFYTAYTGKFGSWLNSPQDRVGKLLGGIASVTKPGIKLPGQPNMPGNPTQPQSGALVLTPIQPLAAIKYKKLIFAQTQGINSLQMLISTAQEIQNSVLSQPMQDFNSQYISSLSKGNVQQLGELARTYSALATASVACATNIKNLLNSNGSLLSTIDPSKKITVIKNIFQPIENLITKVKDIRTKQINPNLGGLFAGSAGSNLDEADVQFQGVTDIVNSLVTGSVGQVSMSQPPAATQINQYSTPPSQPQSGQPKMLS